VISAPDGFPASFHSKPKGLNMNADMLGGIIRAIFPPVIAYLVGRGTLPAGDYGALITAVVSFATAAWSIRSNATGKTIK
jgi:hypothetical protein